MIDTKLLYYDVRDLDITRGMACFAYDTIYINLSAHYWKSFFNDLDRLETVITNTLVHETLHIYIAGVRQELNLSWPEHGEEWICCEMANKDEIRYFYF